MPMKVRRYTKLRRAEAENETRERIVEALMALHEEIGPARTTISAVAQRAGVERLTVYRHFPDETEMIRACSTSWAQRNPLPPLPDLDGDDPLAACRRTLLALYRWYRSNERMLRRIHADRELVPAVNDALMHEDAHLDAVASALDRQWPRRNARRAATLRHAVEFSTWQSLSRIAGDDARAAATVVEWLRRLPSRA